MLVGLLAPEGRSDLGLPGHRVGDPGNVGEGQEVDAIASHEGVDQRHDIVVGVGPRLVVVAGIGRTGLAHDELLELVDGVEDDGAVGEGPTVHRGPDDLGDEPVGVGPGVQVDDGDLVQLAPFPQGKRAPFEIEVEDGGHFGDPGCGG
mgnify:CR=1 FL=1